MTGSVVMMFVLMVVLCATFAEASKHLTEKYMQHADLRSNPMTLQARGITPERTTGLRGADVQSTTYTSGFLVMGYYNDISCTQLVNYYSFQLDKCAFQYAYSGTGYYYNYANATNDGFGYLDVAFEYYMGSCKNNTPEYSYTYTFPSSCSYYYNNLYAMAIIVDTVPTPPQDSVGVMSKVFDERTGECHHANSVSWSKSGYCDYGYSATCTGNGGQHSSIWESKYNSSDCTGAAYETDYSYSSRSFCNQTKVSMDDDTYYAQSKYFCADPMKSNN